MIRKAARMIFLLIAMSSPALAGVFPACLPSNPGTSTESIIASHYIADQELLARLVYAEAWSTGFPDDQAVYDGIAWGVINRVRLGEYAQNFQHTYGRGVRGVIFKKGQFNPAISKRSPFAKGFLCPDHPGRWGMAKSAAEKAVKGEGNPFIRTPWEKRNGLSLVVHFYYPQSIQAKGPFAPWERSKSLQFIGDVLIDGRQLPARIVRFYRIYAPDKD